jgi:hypothetical protein
MRSAVSDVRSCTERARNRNVVCAGSSKFVSAAAACCPTVSCRLQSCCCAPLVVHTRLSRASSTLRTPHTSPATLHTQHKHTRPHSASPRAPRATERLLATVGPRAAATVTGHVTGHGSVASSAGSTHLLLPASYQRILPQTHARGPTHYTRSPAQITSSTASPPSSDSRAQHTRPKASRFKFLGHLFLLALAMRI